MTQPGIAPNRMQTTKAQPSAQPQSPVPTSRLGEFVRRTERAPLIPALRPAPSATTSGITSSADLLARIQGPANAAPTGEGDISRLLTLFPKAKRVNIPMLVRIVTGGKEVWDWEKVWIIYVGADSAIFPSNLTLRGNETLMFRRPGESDMTAAVVVAMQYDGPRVIVAARFVSGTPEWLNAVG